MPDLAALNRLDDDALASALSRCCGSKRWVASMIAARPFPTEDDLYRAAQRAWDALGPQDWLQAFAHHPRIGDQSATTKPGWSRQEQSGMDSATESVRQALARGNVEYEERFGFLFLIDATGKSADEMLAALQQRMAHDRDTELGVAAEQHARITRLRLAKLLLA
jgi:OHCU decarboxylase